MNLLDTEFKINNKVIQITNNKEMITVLIDTIVGIRMEIEKIRLEKMEIGWVKEIKKDDFYRDLNIKY